jgi:SAM-dependent methyltransferase
MDPSSAPPSPAAVRWIHGPCGLCGADRPRPLLVDRVRDGDQVVGFHIVRCGACGFVYVDPRGLGPAFDNEAGGAARRDAAVANQTIYRHGLAALRAAGLPDQGTLLDLGCAYGDFLAFAADAGYRVTGIDLNPASAQLARERGFTVLTGDLRSLEVDQRFDAVTLWDVIEHVDRPVDVLAACRAVLRPGGLVFFHTGNARFQIPKARLLGRLWPGRGPYLIPFQHLSHFDPATARRALEAAGLEPVAVSFAGTLHYRQRWKRWAMGVLNAGGALPPRWGGPLLTNAMGAIGRRPI